MAERINVTIWNEFIHERQDENVRKIYPQGIHQTIAKFLSVHEDIAVKTATLDQPEHGLSEAILNQTDVLIWWGHKAHQQVSDEVIKRVHQKVLEGMGLVVLHSAHYSKIFKMLMGTNCSLRWRDIGEKERLWNIAPGHPIAHGIGDYLELPHSEMYGERFDIPEPDKVIFISWFQGGEVFRSGCCWERGHGRIFYFSPGHETYPIYHQPEIQKVITNAVRWAKPQVMKADKCPRVEPLERFPNDEIRVQR
ncbi:MAG: ThuA domain-containing protein [candidate division KSB1 bacterium]|nr:ThuA domain-containing protein [candidate division KSB1 bacterium]